MKVVITQPTYLPWLGYFELVAQADVFVFLDTVQFERQSWQSRNKIRSADGRVQWLPVPVISAPLDTLIKEIELAPNTRGVFRKQYQTIRQALSKAPFFSEADDLLRPHFDASTIPEKLADLNIRFVQNTASALALTSTRFLRASELEAKGKRESLLISICRELGADYYYSNAGSAFYLEAARGMFTESGIELAYQDWMHPEYTQQGQEFESHLSCIDAIASVGLEQCHQLLAG